MSDMDRILGRLEELEARLSAQDAELQALRAATAPAPEPTPTAELLVPPSVAANHASRRGLIAGAAAAIGALGLGAVAPKADAAPAKANGAPVVTGGSVAATGATDVTRIVNPGGILQNLMFQVDNNTGGTTTVPATARVSIAATNNQAAIAGADHVSLYAFAVNGYGLHSEGKWPLRLVPRTGFPPTTNPPGPQVKEGTFYYGLNTTTFNPGGGALLLEDLFLYMSNSGWRRILNENSAGELIPFGPVRVVDTRTAAASGNPSAPVGFDGTGAQITAGAFPAADSTRLYRIAGKAFANPTVLFPATDTVRGLLCNVTLVQAAPSGGFVTVYPGNLATAPTTSTVNPSGASGITANFTFVGVPTTGAQAGNIAVRSVGEVRDVIIDVVGIYI